MDLLRIIGGYETGGERRRREEREERDERRRECEHDERLERQEKEREERRIKEKLVEEERKKRERQEEGEWKRREKQEEEEWKRREKKEQEDREEKERMEKEMMQQEQEKRQKYEDQSERRRMNDSKYLKNSKVIEIQFIKYLRSLERDLNIIVVGSPGVGKSTLITNIKYAITEEYKEVASCGKYQDGKSYTMYPVRYCLTQSVKRKSDIYLIDSPGLQNRTHTEHMDDLFSGFIDVKEGIRGKTISLKEQMKGESVDRVIFVHSAREAAPEHLCKSVVRTAREYGKIG